MTTTRCQQYFRQASRKMDDLIQRYKPVLIRIMHIIHQFLLYIHDVAWKTLISSGRTTAYTVHLPTPHYHPAVLITGTSTGIGRETALALAQQGYTVMAGVRQKTHGAVLAEELELIRQNSTNTNKNYIPNGTVIPIIMDLADEVTVAEGWSQVEARLAELDVPLVGLINNAGMVVLKVVEHLTVADWNRTLWANFLGAVELTRLALPKLRASHGRIINNGSIAAWLNPPGYASYSASKAAMASWSRSLRSEVIPFGVAVSHIEPGNILTPGPVKALQTLKEQGETTYSVDNEDIPASYRDINAGLTNLFELGVKAGMPAQHVVDHIVHALTSPIPRDKYYVGPDAFLFNSILRCFGETVTDRAVRASVKMLNA